MDHKEVSSKGGNVNKQKYSEMITLPDGRVVNKHFYELGKRGMKARVKKYGTEVFKELSRLGVAGRKKKADAKKTLGQKIIDAVSQKQS